MGGRKDWVSCFVRFVFVLIVVKNLEETNAISVSSSYRHVDIGAVTDQSSRMGRQQKIAIEMAFQTFHFSTNTFPKLELSHRNSNGNSARAIISGNSNSSSHLFFFNKYQIEIKHELRDNFFPLFCLLIPSWIFHFCVIYFQSWLPYY